MVEKQYSITSMTKNLKKHTLPTLDQNQPLPKDCVYTTSAAKEETNNNKTCCSNNNGETRLEV